ncbi:MAG TPA: VWA domain-containing protein [Thermoanaerobaculia bacterium]|nr:VWA domain-containing protein [Thermoanaerobaculia bacterium]
MRRAVTILFFIAAIALADEKPNALTIVLEPLGDSDAGVVTRTTFRFAIPTDVPEGVPLVIIGSISEGGQVVKRFRYPLLPTQRESLSAIQTLQPGEAEVEARLMVPLEEQTPVIVAKNAAKFTIAKTNKAYVANAAEGAEAIIAEGSVPEVGDAVKIIPPHRDVAPNLFIVDVEVKPPVKRVEFWVEGKKILTRNAPPYRAELDLGRLPKRVEVRAVGYDDRGHYVDADAFVVNEHETPLEVKLTRTQTPDRVSHVKLSIQNPKGASIKTVALFADQKKFHQWSGPPYAIDIPDDRLQNVRFLRASVIDAGNYEASDLLFLNGAQINEELEVNLIELPVAVTDSAGVPIGGLARTNFQVLENAKPQKITNFDAASNLPISVGLLIDHSGSMKPRMEATRKAATEFLARIIKPADRAFVSGFAFESAKIAPFVSDKASLAQQVASIPDAGGGTSLYDAIITGLYRFRNLQGRKALIILTDGEDTTSRISYDDMLTYARAARVPLYFIGVGLGALDFAGTNKMKSLAAETGGVAYFIKDVKKLEATYTQLEKDLRSQYLLAYNTESMKTDKNYRTVEVKVDRPDARVRTIRGFLP